MYAACGEYFSPSGVTDFFGMLFGKVNITEMGGTSRTILATVSFFELLFSILHLLV
jgi:hypothetical protein